ncbi:MAG: oligoendopeptidase F [Pseudomonadota bacterium]
MNYITRLFNRSALAVALTAGSLQASFTQATGVPERAEVSAEYKWDLTTMYADGDAWEADAAVLQSLIDDLTAYQGRLGEDGETLLGALKARERVGRVVDNLVVYSGLKYFEDQRAGESAERYSRGRSLSADYQQASAFFRPELLAIAPEDIEAMIESTPELVPYRHYFKEESRMLPYTLSEAEERIIAMANDPLGKFQSVFTSLDNADLTFGEIKNEDGETITLTRSLYGAFLTSQNRQVREDAWKGLFAAYEELGNTLAANYEGHVKAQIFEAKARGFDSALQQATYSSAIPEAVYLSLLKAIREKGTAPLQRFLKIRGEALGVERQEIWDLYAPIIEPAYSDIPWEVAKEMVAEAVMPLGDEYVDLYWFGFGDGWVDSLDNAGKRGGAYSWGTMDSKPYFSMSYQGTLDDVSTLAHEYGHSLHSYLSRNTQPYVYAYYETFVAEVASMTNEALLIQKLLAEAETAEQRVYLLQSYLDKFRGSFYRQASFADFEMQAHAAVEAGEALSKDSLNKIYADVFNDYYGDAVHADALNASEWSRIPHFMRTDNFYVYQYATSFVAATALAKKIREEGAPARDKFLTMLRSGSSDYAIELLKDAGVDMTTPEPVYQTIEVFDAMVTDLEQALAELD